MSKGRDFYRKETETEEETNGFHLSLFFPSRTRKLSGKISNEKVEIFPGKKGHEKTESTRKFWIQVEFWKLKKKPSE